MAVLKMSTTERPVSVEDAAIGRAVHELLWERDIPQQRVYDALQISRSSLTKKMRGEVRWSAKDVASLHAVWSSFDTVGQKAFCEAAIQDGENFYGPAMAFAEKAGNGATQYDAQQFLLEFCPDAWLIGPDRF